jgi:hypothetical protein
VAALLLSVLAGVPEARAEYANGSFLGVFTASTPSTGRVNLQSRQFFPQVTTGDYVPADVDNHAVDITSGVTVDFFLGVGELSSDTVPGKMRLTQFQLATPTEPRLLVIGTYTLFMSDDAGPYQISGPVLGDRFTLYIPGKDTKGTDVASDDAWFLLKVNESAVGPDPEHPAYLTGRAQILMGDRVLVHYSEGMDVFTSADGAGMSTDLVAPGLSSGTLNQIRPADGSADIALSGDTAAFFISGRTRVGTIGAGLDPYTVFGGNLMRKDGPGATGQGIFLNRFTRTLPGGKLMQGFTLGDTGPADADGITAFDGYTFGFVTGQAAPAILFGEVDGLANAEHANAGMGADLVAVDFVPPEVYPVGQQRDLFCDRFTPYDTYAFDFNGWQDVTSVQLLINDTMASNRILARYDAVKNRLSLFNKATNSWVGSCIPGTTAMIKTPYVTLDCKATSVNRNGEILRLEWSLKPTARMLPVLHPKAYVKITDRAGLVAGWRELRSEQSITSVGPPTPP